MQIFNYSKVYVALLFTIIGYIAKPLYFNKVILFSGHNNVKINDFRKLIDSEELEEKFTDLLNSRPIGFYYDTLYREIYLNNYEIKEQNINPRDSADFSRFRSLLMVDNQSPRFQLIKQKDNGNPDKLFQHKVPLNAAKSKTLFKITSGLVENLINPNKDEQTVKIERPADLNNDGVKEKVIFYLSYKNNGDGRQPLLVKLRINYTEIRNKVWKIYDQLTFSSEQLEGGLNSIHIFKLAEKRPPMIYIDTEFTTLTGSILRSQLLLTTSGSKASAPIITIY